MAELEAVASCSPNPNPNPNPDPDLNPNPVPVPVPVPVPDPDPSHWPLTLISLGDLQPCLLGARAGCHLSDAVVVVQPETEGAARISLERALDLVWVWVWVRIRVRMRVKVEW